MAGQMTARTVPLTYPAHVPTSAGPSLDMRGPHGRRMIHFAPDENLGGAGGGAAGAGAGAGAGGAGEGDKKPEVSFTGEQQAFIQKLVDDAYGRANAKAETKFKGDLLERDNKIKTFEEQLAAATAAAAAAGDPEKGEAGKPAANQPAGKTFTEAQLQQALSRRDDEWKAKFEPVQNELTEFKDQTQRMLSNERTSAIVNAAAKAKAYDPEDIATLVARFVVHDEAGKIQVINPDTGNPLVSSKGLAMTVDEFVKDYIDRKPHLKQGANSGGAGSSSRYTPGGAAAQTQAGPPKSWADAAQAAAVAMAGGNAGR